MGEVEFDSFYREQWGERWPALREALARPEIQVARHNIFASVDLAEFRRWAGLGLTTAFEASPELRAELPRGESGLLGFYVQDPASIWIAEQLNVQAGDVVLDMCAAPGGKSLVLIEAIRDEGEILANEPSPARRERLTRVIQQYVPRDVRDRVRVTGKDGGLFSKTHPETFDRILIDAPCSGERHLLGNPAELAKWSPSRSKKLAQEQYALLCGALEALSVGGTAVYSTCSLSRFENESTLERFLDRKGERFEFEELPCPEGGERTRFGVQFLPDRCGFGPLFAARFRKI